jgi:uncharacterized membrane protein YfcA
MPVSMPQLIIALAVTALGAVVQGTIGTGFAVVSVPILSLVNPALAPVPQLLMAVPLTLSMAWREREDIALPGVAWVTAGRLLGALVGYQLLIVATQRTLDLGIAVAVLTAVVVLSTGTRVPRNGATELGTGVVSGVMSLIASVGGPPVALLFKDAEGATIRSTLATIFALGLGISIVTRIAGGKISGDDVTLAVVLFPGLTIGYLLSSRLRYRVNAALLKRGILVVSAVAAVGLLIRALGR